jgi:hypothetical protein
MVHGKAWRHAGHRERLRPARKSASHTPIYHPYGKRSAAPRRPARRRQRRRTLLPPNPTGRRRFRYAQVVGKTVVLNAGCDKLAADLRVAGYTPVAVELDEFLKSGGSAKCVTLRLDGEEAAVWE